MWTLLAKMFQDAMMESQSDGTRKWSWFRISGFLWFWLGLMPALAMNLIKGNPISPEIKGLTEVFLGGAVAGKLSTSLNTFIDNKFGGK